MLCRKPAALEKEPPADKKAGDTHSCDGNVLVYKCGTHRVHIQCLKCPDASHQQYVPTSWTMQYANQKWMSPQEIATLRLQNASHARVPYTPKFYGVKKAT